MKFSIIATPAEVAELYSRLVSGELELNLDDCDDCDCACDCEDDEDDADDAKPATLTVKFVSSDGKFSILDLMEKVKKNKRH